MRYTAVFALLLFSLAGCSRAPDCIDCCKETVIMNAEQKLEIIEALYKKDFAKLNYLLPYYQSLFNASVANENLLWDAFATFRIDDTDAEPIFDAWIAQYPDAACALVARAEYFCFQAGLRRGYKFKSETSPQQFEAMETCIVKTKNDARAALALDPGSVMACKVMIKASIYHGDIRLATEYLKKALLVAPYSFLIRAEYIKNLEPRWGGSQKLMTRFALLSQSYVPCNSRMTALLGYRHYDQAQLTTPKDAQASLAMYDAALAYGDLWLFHSYKGYALTKLKNYEAAIKEFDAALNTSIQPEVLQSRADALLRYLYEPMPGMQRLQYLNAGYEDIQLARQLNKADKSIQKTFENYEKLMQWRIANPNSTFFR